MTTYLNEYYRDIKFIIFSYLYPIYDMKQLYDIYINDNEQSINSGIHYLKEYILKQTKYRLDLSLYEYNDHLYDTLELYNYIQSYYSDYMSKHRHIPCDPDIVDRLCLHINFHNIYKLYTIFLNNTNFDGKTIQETKNVMIESILKLDSAIIDKHVINYNNYKTEFVNRLNLCIESLI